MRVRYSRRQGLAFAAEGVLDCARGVAVDAVNAREVLAVLRSILTNRCGERNIFSLSENILHKVIGLPVWPWLTSQPL
jgi:hypothetical protein